MKYRDAKNIVKGDWVTRKSDRVQLEVDSVELFGQYQKAKFNCILPLSKGGSDFVAGTTITYLFNDEVE